MDTHTVGEVKALIAPVVETSAEEIEAYAIVAETGTGLAIISNLEDKETALLMIHSMKHLLLRDYEEDDDE